MHYVSYGTPGGEYASQCRAAIITDIVEKDDAGNTLKDVVSLCILNPTGQFFNTVVFHDEINKKAGTWHWPERV